MGDVDGPLRLCYEGAVTRLSSGRRGQREILQAGVELIDAETPDGDAEAIAVAAAALGTAGVDHVRLDIGHVAPVEHALGAIPGDDQRAEVRAALARKDRAGVARAAAGLPPALTELCVALPVLYGAPRPVLARARALRWPAGVRRALDTVEAVIAMTAEVVDPALHASFTVDLGEVRGFEYYTGIRFAGYAAGAGDAVLRGGRYDSLVGRYGRTARATGFAVDIEAIAQAQRAAAIEPPTPRAAVLVSAGRERRREASRVAAALRAGGQRAAVDLGRRRGRGALVAYAQGVGFSRVLLLDGGEARVIDVAAGDAAARRGVPVSQAAVRRAAAGEPSDLLRALALGAAPRVRRA
jgi:ATP phosphoribosyltransferase regulatory subunit